MSRVTRGTVAGRAYLDLQAKARRDKRATAELLQLYALEGFLGRMAASAAAKNLVLKGGVLLAAYDTRRPTRDIDLAARHLANDTGRVLALVQEVLSETTDDGWIYGAPAAEQIRADEKYSGVRVRVPATLAAARVSFDVDVSVGDPISPRARDVEVPRLLGGSIRVKGYPLSMVYAEKLVTAVQRGAANTRWRDFADVFLLSGQHETAAEEIGESVARVARFRQVALTSLSTVLEGFGEQAQSKWAAWVRRQGLGERLPDSFANVLERVFAFADPVFEERAVGRWLPARRRWVPPASTR